MVVDRKPGGKQRHSDGWRNGGRRLLYIQPHHRQMWTGKKCCTKLLFRVTSRSMFLVTEPFHGIELTGWAILR